MKRLNSAQEKSSPQGDVRGIGVETSPASHPRRTRPSRLLQAAIVIVTLVAVATILFLGDRSELHAVGPVVLVLMTGGTLLYLTSHRWSRSLQQEVQSRTKELRETSDYLTRLIRFANAPIIVWNPDKRINIFNRAFEQMSGRSAEEVIGEPLDELFPSETRSDSLEKIQKASAGEYWENVEIPILRKDGQIRLGLWNSANIYGQDGKTLIATVAQGQDITEHKRAEEAMRQSEKLFRNLMEHTSGMSIQGYETDGTVRYWNRASEEVYGYTAAEAIGRNLGDLIIPPDVKPLYDKALELGAKTTESGEFLPAGDLELLRKDGSLVPVHSTHTAVCIEGKAPLLFCIDIDLAERKRAEEALVRSEAKYRTLVEQLPVTTYIDALDESGTTTYVSPQIKSFLGVSPDTYLKSPGFWNEHLHPDDRERVLSELTKCRETGEPLRSEYRVVHPSGDVVWVRDEAVIVRDADGTPLFLQGVVLDITDRKRAEEEKVVLQDQLRQAQKMEAVGRLAGGIAHDFNNQLTVVKGYCDLLLQGISEEDTSHQPLDEIRQAAERATKLTGQLLAFSRKQMLQPQVINLNDVLAGMADPLARIIGEDIRLSIVPAGDLGNVRVDAAQVEQAVMNLAVNARDAMPDGGDLVIETANVDLDAEYVSKHAGASPGPHVMLAVSDTGEGMDEETRRRVFEPFFTTKPAGEGTGLGLAMVYGFVKQSGGLIYVYSEPGKGTTLKLYFPSVSAAVEKPVERPPTAQRPRGAETILVAEDDQAVRRMLVRVLRERGYTVLETSNAREAIPLGEHYDNTIHLLITDVVMPGMDGPELAARLKVARPDLQVLYISGYTENTVVHRGVVDSEANLLAKPFGPDQLAQAVRNVLDADKKKEEGS